MRKYFLTYITIVVALVACTNNGKLPTVQTGKYTTYPETKTAQCEGYVETDGGEVVFDRGICYVVGSATPTIADIRVSAGSGKGSFTAVLTEINEDTYTYRAYATNSAGTAYGSPYSFTMTSSSTTGGGVIPENGGNDNPQDNANEKLKPILGKYRMSCALFDPFDVSFSWGNTQSKSWSGIRIYPNTLYGELGVAVEGLYEGNVNYGACGKYYPNKKQLTLYADTHTGSPFSMIYNYDNNTYMVTALFSPRSYRRFNTGGYSVLDGSWLPIGDGDSIIFDLTAANTLTMSNIPNTSDAQVFSFDCVTDANESISSTYCIQNVVLTRITGAY